MLDSQTNQVLLDIRTPILGEARSVVHNIATPLTITASSHTFSCGTPGTRFLLCCNTTCSITSMVCLYSAVVFL